MNPKKRAGGEGAALAAIGLFGAWGAWLVPSAPEGETWAGMLPMLTSMAILAGGITVGVQGWRAAAESQANSDAASESESDKTDESRAAASGLIKVLLLFLLALAYYQAVVWAGYVLPTAVAASCVFAIFGFRKPMPLIAAAVLCPLCFYLLFFVALGAYPPQGWILTTVLPG